MASSYESYCKLLETFLTKTERVLELEKLHHFSILNLIQTERILNQCVVKPLQMFEFTMVGISTAVNWYRIRAIKTNSETLSTP